MAVNHALMGDNIASLVDARAAAKYCCVSKANQAPGRLLSGVKQCIITLLCLQLCDGASSEERARWFLKPAQEFRYLNQSTCFDIPGDSNAEEYQVSSFS